MFTYSLAYHQTPSAPPSYAGCETNIMFLALEKPELI